MKIAICLAGLLRTFETAHTHWVSSGIFEEHDCDVFLHTWDFVGNKMYPDAHGASLRYQQYDYNDIIPFPIHQLITKFNITDVDIEQFYPYFHNRFTHETSQVHYNKLSTRRVDPALDNIHAYSQATFVNNLAMLYKRWKCFEMMSLYAARKGVQYDYVILTRPDYSLNIDFSRIPMDKLLVPQLHPEKSDVHDVYAIGPLHLVREYCLYYARFERLVFDEQRGIRTPPFGSIPLYHYLTQINMPFDYIRLNDPTPPVTFTYVR